MPINKYYLSALTAFIIWGSFSLVLKPLHDYPSLDILFYRLFFSVALLLAINLCFRRSILKNNWLVLKALEKKERAKIVLLTVTGGILLITNWFLFIYAINHVSLKSASFAYLICPILTTILAFFILNEKLSKWQWTAVGLSIISCGILSFGNIAELLYSVTIAFTFALYLILQRKYKQFDRLIVLAVQIMIAAIIILPFFPKYSGTLPQQSLFYILVGTIAVFYTVIPLFLNLYALKGINSSAVGILMYTNPLINFLLAVFYFREAIGVVQIVSYSLILVSVVVFNEKILFKRRTAVSNKY